MVMDAMGILVFFLDLLGVYKALKHGGEMPEPLCKYEDYIVKEHERCANEARFEKDKKFYDEYFRSCGEPTYSGVHGPAFLEKERKKKKNPDIRVPMAYNPLYNKCNMIVEHIGPEDTEKIVLTREQMFFLIDTQPEGQSHLTRQLCQ